MATPAVLLFQQGKHLVNVVVTPQAVNATTGALTDVSGASVTLTTRMQDLGIDAETQQSEVNSLNSGLLNNIIEADGVSLNMAVYKVNNGSDPTPLRTLYRTYDYFKVTYTEGTGGSARTGTYYGLRSRYSDSFQGRGAQIAQFGLTPIDTGAVSPWSFA
jgi:hypothetical protein